MKTLDNTNLGYLLTKIKNAFIRTTDVESVSEITIDSTPTANSDNLVTSGGVHTALGDKQDTIDSSNKLSADLVEDGTTNKVYTSTEQTKLGSIEAGAQVNVKPDWNAASGNAAEILNKPTIDNSPTQGSSNAVSSGGVYAELDDVAHIDVDAGSVVSLNIESTLNKVTTISDQSTDVQYPSAKAVYDGLVVKENATIIDAPVNQTDATLPITALSCEVGKYYRIDVAIGTLAITFPAPDDVTRISSIVISFTTNSAPAVTFTASAVGGVVPPIYAQDGFVINASTTYEVNVIFNGAAWIVAAMEIGSTALI